MKPFALILIFVALLGAVFFISNDIRFTWMLLDDSYSGAFETMSTLEVWQELTLLIIYLLLNILLLIFAFRLLVHRQYTKSVLFSCLTITLYAFQLLLWTATTVETP